MQRITTAHPEPFTHKHTLTPASAFLLHVSPTIDADKSGLGHVGAFYGVLNPKAWRCAKNSAATIGIINIARPTPPAHFPPATALQKLRLFQRTNTFHSRNLAKAPALNQQKRGKGKARPWRRGVETSAGHCFDESRLCIASLPEYQHQSSATHSSREPPEPPAAHLCGSGGRQTSQHVSRSAFTPLPSCNSWECFFIRRRGDEEIHLLTDSAILDFCSSPSSVTWSAPTFTRGGITDGWRWDSTACPIIGGVCTKIWIYDRVITRGKWKKYFDLRVKLEIPGCIHSESTFSTLEYYSSTRYDQVVQVKYNLNGPSSEKERTLSPPGDWLQRGSKPLPPHFSGPIKFAWE